MKRINANPTTTFYPQRHLVTCECTASARVRTDREADAWTDAHLDAHRIAARVVATDGVISGAVHAVALKRIGSQWYSSGHVQAVCSCGWESVPFSTATVEGRTLAEDRGAEHLRIVANRVVA